MSLSFASTVLFGVAAFSLVVLAIEIVALRIIRRRRLPELSGHPSVSILKPLCGWDDDLLENLESHLALDYDGPWEILLGVRSEQDTAYPIARDFAAAHPDRVRVVLQLGEPGHNPKVNQL